MRKKFCRKSWLIGVVLGLVSQPLPMVGSGEAEENGGGSENTGDVTESE